MTASRFVVLRTRPWVKSGDAAGIRSESPRATRINRYSLSVPVREASSTLGRPDVKSVDAAREAGAGLIVMGAFGRNRITDYFLGSNAAAVVRTSPIAVLLAR